MAFKILLTGDFNVKEMERMLPSARRSVKGNLCLNINIVVPTPQKIQLVFHDFPINVTSTPKNFSPAQMEMFKNAAAILHSINLPERAPNLTGTLFSMPPLKEDDDEDKKAALQPYALCSKYILFTGPDALTEPHKQAFRLNPLYLNLQKAIALRLGVWEPGNEQQIIHLLTEATQNHVDLKASLKQLDLLMQKINFRTEQYKIHTTQASSSSSSSRAEANSTPDLFSTAPKKTQ